MCGIAGFVDVATPDRDRLLDAMVANIAHRGPDDRGYFVDERAGLGMTRLSIIDLDGGHQPKTAAEGAIQVVFNGEIYNYRELRSELIRLGQCFETESDTEVVAKAFEAWDTGAFTRFSGMFAIAVWDRRQGQLSLARDRIGKKPLYIWRHGAALAFASELKALAPLRSFGDIDEQAFVEYLHLGYVPAPRSIWTRVKKLRAGHVAQFTHRKLRCTRYWQLPTEAPATDPADPTGELKSCLSDATASRLVADVEVGTLLSGGIDSSIVTWMASELHPAIHTFSVGFEDPALDESDVARRVASALGTTHHETSVTSAEAIRLIADLPEVYDEPFADPSAIPTLLVSRFARQHVKVVLSGDGGDELFSGYERYHRVRRHLKLQQWMPRVLDGPIRRIADDRPQHVFQRVVNVLDRQGRSPATTYLNLVAILAPRLLAATIGRAPDLSAMTALFEAAFAGDEGRGPRYADLVSYLPDDILVKVDRASMSTGLEVRAPFLDTRVVEWAISLTAAALGRPGSKELPRRLLASRLGPEITDRPKQGFTVPVGPWLRGPLRPLLDEHLSPSALRVHGLIQPAPVDELRVRLDAGSRGAAEVLWTLLAFQLWYHRWASKG